jgi:GH25 family lysozyme M1 (1,4-beta-N-acetylmuramidase)
MNATFGRRARRTVAALGLLALVSMPACALAASGQPATQGSDIQVNQRAQHAGVTVDGGGTMGWELKGTQGSPNAAAATPDAGLALASTTQVAGIDVASYQGNVDWAKWWGYGNRFAYVKATEGTSYTNPYFAQQYNGSYNQGFIRGAYHFARPSSSGGKAQADYFVNHGGGWSGDGKTLPGVLDIEYNPYSGGTCYGLSASSMVSWISAFLAEYKYRTGRDAVIYSTTDWWKTCTGNTTRFSSTNPLWIARYASTVGTLPGAWTYYTFWQNTDTPLDGDLFNGSMTRLQALALG